MTQEKNNYINFPLCNDVAFNDLLIFIAFIERESPIYEHKSRFIATKISNKSSAQYFTDLSVYLWL